MTQRNDICSLKRCIRHAVRYPGDRQLGMSDVDVDMLAVTTFRTGQIRQEDAQVYDRQNKTRQMPFYSCLIVRHLRERVRRWRRNTSTALHWKVCSFAGSRVFLRVCYARSVITTIATASINGCAAAGRAQRVVPTFCTFCTTVLNQRIQHWTLSIHNSARSRFKCVWLKNFGMILFA
jgi:hypothetical protein